MTTALTTLTQTLAAKLDMGDGADLIGTLKATAFKGQVTDAQMTALLIVANQYNLNPWTKEIYAFPDKNNGIVPVVGVDGWSRIINDNPQFDGIEFEQDEQSCTCIIHRKDRGHPVRVTEWMSECKRGTGPWSTHPRRMLRHKAMIQCARLAFGYGGIYDQDEADRIVEATPIEKMPPPASAPAAPALPAAYDADKFAANLPSWRALIASGKKTADQIIATVNSKAPLTPEQQAAIRAPEPPEPPVSAPAPAPKAGAAPAVTFEQIADALRAAPDSDQLASAATLIAAIGDPQERAVLNDLYEQRAAELDAANKE